MNKRIVVTVSAMIAGFNTFCGAAQYASTNLVNESGLAYNNTYTLNVSTFPNLQQGVTRVSAQVIYSSMAPVAVSYNGGRASSATIIVVSTQGIVGVKATDKITVPSTSLILAAPATAQIVVSSGVPGSIITINGNQLREGYEWNRADTSSGSASNLASAINTYLASSLTAATTGWKTVWTTATIAGAGGNGYTLTSSTPTVITTTTFSGGRNPALFNQWISFNGDKQYNGYLWTDGSGTSTGTAASIATWLNNYGVIRATATGSVVYATATVEGAAANSYTLTASTTYLTIQSSAFTGGQDTATLTINGLVLSAGTQGSGTFAVGATIGATAINISSAIMNTASMRAIVVSTTVGSGTTVFSTSTAVGTISKYTIASSTPALLVPTSGLYYGGTNSSSTINSSILTVTSHGLTTGLKVVQSTGSGVQLAPLASGTTYFAIRIDANNFSLATTSTGAVAGSAITITSSSTLTTAPSFTLTASPIAGSVSWKWQASNDGLNWTDLVTPSSYTIGSFVYPSTSTVIDFGDVDYQQLRMNVVAPTAGGLAIKVPINGRL